jgi:hypothetical protein
MAEFPVSGRTLVLNPGSAKSIRFVLFIPIVPQNPVKHVANYLYADFEVCSA